MSVSIRRIGRQGASLSLTIPRDLAESLELRRGDDVVLSVQDGALVMRPFSAELLARVLPRLPVREPDNGNGTE